MLALFLVHALMAATPALAMQFDSEATQDRSEKPQQWNANRSSSLQIIVVTAEDWSSTTGRLQRYERATTQDSFTKAGEAFSVNLGKNGLAWGRGLHNTDKSLIGYQDPLKFEGDGRATAGVFEIGTAFGHDFENMSELTQKRRKSITPNDICVDDVSSAHYNQFVPLDDALIKGDGTVATDKFTASHEQLLRKDIDAKEGFADQYELAVPVNHNGLLNLGVSPQLGLGSCIFLHIEGYSGKPTSGCTSMAKANLVNVVNWLNAKKYPVLIQTLIKDLPDFVAL